MRRIAPLLVALAASAAAAWFFLPEVFESYDQEQTIADASHPVVLTLRAPEGVRPTSLSVLVEGRLEGAGMRVRQAYFGGEEMLVREFGPGEVRQRFGGDWYDGTSVLLFEPKGSVSGRLRVRYRFR